MIYNLYKKQMIQYGESYASAFYLMAALVLGLAGAGMHKFFDSAAGFVFFMADITILALQFCNKAPKARAVILFGGSILGSFILLGGSLIDDFAKALSDMETLGASIRLVSNIILVFASFCGLMSLFPKIKTRLPENPGQLYLVSYGLFFLFALVQFAHSASMLSFGYIIATILWLLASNAIRLKFDEGTK